MSEAHMRRRVVQWLRPLDAMPVENPAKPGTPDVEYKGGWIELKKLASWPRREEAPVVIEHFTPQQRLWLRERRRRGGQAHLLLQVKNEWLLLDGDVAAALIGLATRATLRLSSVKYWPNGLRAEELRTILTA